MDAHEWVSLRRSEFIGDYLRAAHADLPESTWHQILREYPDMHFWVAQNKHVPMSILRVVATSPDEKARSMVVSKRKVTAELLAMMKDDPDETIRRRIAEHPKTPRWVVQLLASDKSSIVSDAARVRLTENR